MEFLGRVHLTNERVAAILEIDWFVVFGFFELVDLNYEVVDLKLSIVHVLGLDRLRCQDFV